MPPDEQKSVLSKRSLGIAAVAALGAAAVVVVSGVTTRETADARLREWTENRAVPVVGVIKPQTQSRRTTLDLPGRLEAYSQAQIYARVSGYLKEWKADAGTPVKAGQVLAEIEAPDLDQQIMQAIANVASAEANANLAIATLERGQSLISSGAVSKSDLDQRSADAANKRGLVKSAQANLERLRVLEKYKQITAPFAGLVTARTTDVGALINAGSGGGPALFVVSDTTRLRAYVNVPQNYVPSIPIGTRAQITVPEYPGRNFDATVEASAQSVDAGSGTTRMQLAVDNAQGALMTGSYTNVRLTLAHPDVAVNIPASALMFDQTGLRVATVDADGKVKLATVTIARDLGRTVEIGSGLTADDRVIESPPDGIAAGDAVRVAGDTPQTASAAAK
jgi:RND family efflux transporter MFP subunit